MGEKLRTGPSVDGKIKGNQARFGKYFGREQELEGVAKSGRGL